MSDHQEEIEMRTDALLDLLQKNPDHVWIGPTLTAVWLSAMEKFLIVTGDFRSLKDDELRLLLNRKITALIASRN